MLSVDQCLKMDNQIPENAIQRRIYEAAIRLFAKTGTTDINMSELAREADVGRATVYSYVKSKETLFEHVAAGLGFEMKTRVAGSLPDTVNPLVRIAFGIRFYVRRAQEEPHWGRFLQTFGFRAMEHMSVLGSSIANDLRQGIELGSCRLRQDQLVDGVALVSSAALGAIFLIISGREGWRSAGSSAAELVLVALGVPAEEALRIATEDLPPLRPLDECR